MESPIEDPAVILLPGALDLIFHPFAMGVFVVAGLAEFRDSKRRHNSLRLLLRVLRQVSRHFNTHNQKRSAAGMHEHDIRV
jgi:hypothetical protein